MNKLRSIVGPRIQAALLLALIAGVGMLVGMTVERLFASPPATAEASARPDGPRQLRGPWRAASPERGPFYLQHLTRELDLSAEQKAQIERILATQQERFREITRELEPRLREAAESARRDIVDVLDDEQQRQFRELRRVRQPGRRPGRSFMNRTRAPGQ